MFQCGSGPAIPFTEPSAEVMQWRGRWLEVMAGGMVDPAVLEGLGLDPER